MEGYLGTEVVNAKDIPEFCDMDSRMWALYFIEMYGGIDGAHHKDWVLDQVARLLLGSPVVAEKATWKNGHHEYRIHVGTPSNAYIKWVDDFDGNYTTGTAP